MAVLTQTAAFFAKMRFHARVFKLGIRPEELVLEIGSGSSPHYRADVLCDLSLTDDRERSGPLNLDRPFVVGDAQALPFRDKSFDFIICNHLLEHVQHPERCLKELMRVGRRGYIETPSEFAEKLCGLPKHRWFVRRDAARLVFTQKRRPIYDTALAAGFWSAWNQNDPAYRLFHWRNPDLFYTRFFWQGKIEYEVKYAETVEEHLFISAAPGVGEDTPRKGLRGENCYDSFAENLLRHCALGLLAMSRRKRQHHIDLRRLIACPDCKGGLKEVGNNLACPACRKHFPLWQDTPLLLAAEGKALEKQFDRIAV